MKKFNSGIYIIVNKINGHFYLGSCKDFNKRKRDHFNNLKYLKHQNQYLQNAYNLYGYNNFEFIIVCRCLPEERLEIEQLFLNKRFIEGKDVCQYNIAIVSCGGNLGEESNKKISLSKKQLYKNID